MTTEIPIHYSSEDIQQLKLKIESNTWISRLEFVQSEMEFFSFLVLSEEIKKELDTSKILKFISRLTEDNKTLRSKMIEYKNQLDGMRECEDLQCDSFYLNDHEVLREKVEQHRDNIQKLKLTIFKELKTVLQ